MGEEVELVRWVFAESESPIFFLQMPQQPLSILSTLVCPRERLAGLGAVARCEWRWASRWWSEVGSGHQTRQSSGQLIVLEGQPVHQSLGMGSFSFHVPHLGTEHRQVLLAYRASTLLSPDQHLVFEFFWVRCILLIWLAIERTSSTSERPTPDWWFPSMAEWLALGRAGSPMAEERWLRWVLRIERRDSSLLSRVSSRRLMLMRREYSEMAGWL